MLRSLSSGVSGLAVNQTQMDIIANNIANINTIGFKSSRATFQEVFSDMLGGAAGPSDTTNRGGVNPMQIGMGASLASIDKNMNQGAADRTDNPFDIMIAGSGFLIVGDSSGTYFTRAGALDIDKAGNLVTTGGMKVMGWPAVPDANNPGQYVCTPGNVQPITIGGSAQYVAPETTRNIQMQGNLNALKTDANGNHIINSTMDFFDSLGNRYVVDTQYKYNPPTATNAGYWEYQVGQYAYANNDRTQAYPVAVTTPNTTPSSASPAITFTGSPIPQTSVNTTANPPITAAVFAFDVNGFPAGAAMGADPAGIAAASGNSLSFVIQDGGAAGKPLLTPAATFGDGGNPGSLAAGGSVTVDFGMLTQFDATVTVQAVKLDGCSPGRLNSVSIGPDGKVTGLYTNGNERVLGQIPVAQFPNPAGLMKVGNNLFQPTANSGDFDGIGQEISASGGSMQSGALEMSNVDLAKEFTNMITAQRAFQANSRVITVSDDILNQLVNMIR